MSLEEMWTYFLMVLFRRTVQQGSSGAVLGKTSEKTRRMKFRYLKGSRGCLITTNKRDTGGRRGRENSQLASIESNGSTYTNAFTNDSDKKICDKMGTFTNCLVETESTNPPPNRLIVSLTAFN